jgi:hypothetical protein
MRSFKAADILVNFGKEYLQSLTFSNVSLTDSP